MQNKNGTTPHFLIVNNLDFEYVACLHSLDYNGQDINRFIQDKMGFRSIDDFKANKDIYNVLNSNGRTYQNMVAKITSKPKLLKNEYMIKKKSFDIESRETIIDWDSVSGKSSNIEEFFDVIDW